MTLTVFLNQLLAMQLSMNEISVLLELGYKGFSREDILSNPNRCPLNTYSPSALTRTLQKLSSKNPAIIHINSLSKPKPTYELINKCSDYDKSEYAPILLSITRSRVLTVNTMRVALQMIVNKKKISTARYLANQLNLNPDYLAATVLPRMIVIGLLKTSIIVNADESGDINLLEKDKSIDKLHGICLNSDWKGTSETTLL